MSHPHKVDLHDSRGSKVLGGQMACNTYGRDDRDDGGVEQPADLKHHSLLNCSEGRVQGDRSCVDPHPGGKSGQGVCAYPPPLQPTLSTASSAWSSWWFRS